MVLMCIALIKAILRDSIRASQGGQTAFPERGA